MTTINSSLKSIISNAESKAKDSNNNGKIDTEGEIILFERYYQSEVDSYSSKIKNYEKELCFAEDNDKKTEVVYAKRGQVIGGIVGAVGAGLLLAGPLGWGVALAGAILGGALGLAGGDLAGRGVGKIVADDADNMRIYINDLKNEQKELVNAYNEYKSW